MPFLSLGYALLILGLANLDRLRASPPGRLSRFLGQLSYPLYILHVALMLAFSIIFYNAFKLSPAGLYVLFFAVAAGIVAICILVTIFLDQPLQNVLKKKQQKNF
jgi:peptidoglycan/LPS O-acetylase OafA/YrhL